jgi:hypothetical protein
VASILDTDSFINAMRRFIASKGNPPEMRSANRGNFVSGEKELRLSIKYGIRRKSTSSLSEVMTCEVMNMPKEQILDNEGLFTLRLFSK